MDQLRVSNLPVAPATPKQFTLRGLLLLMLVTGLDLWYWR